MRNNRGIFMFASAMVWSGMIWGMAQIRPTIFAPPKDNSPPTVTVNPIEPEPLPPPPIKKKETEETPIVRPPPIAALPTRPRVPTPSENYDGPPVSELNLGGHSDEGGETVIATSSTSTKPPAAPLVIADIADICEEEARNPRPLTGFNVDRAYPTRLEEQEITGLVHAVWEIDANGLPVEVRIQSSSNTGFNQAVVTEGMRMRFRPARKECENIKGIFALNVKFELNGEQ